MKYRIYYTNKYTGFVKCLEAINSKEMFEIVEQITKERMTIHHIVNL